MVSGIGNNCTKKLKQVAKVILDLSSRFASAFGAINVQPLKVVLSSKANIYRLESYKPLTEDFERLSLKYNDKEIVFGSGSLSSKKSIEGILAPPPLISFSREKSLIETPVNGGDVVERWGTNPWNIKLSGLLIDIDNRHYPTDRVTKLNKLFNYNGIIEVSGTQFLEKDITSLYFKHVDIKGVQGFQDTVQYTITARSSSPVSFTLINPNQ